MRGFDRKAAQRLLVGHLRTAEAPPAHRPGSRACRLAEQQMAQRTGIAPGVFDCIDIGDVCELHKLRQVCTLSESEHGEACCCRARLECSSNGGI